MAVNVLSLCHVRETSPGTHTFFPTYTCPVYCWRSVQLLDFGLYCNLIHASQPIRTTFTGQWFASSFLQTPPHDDALAFGCTLPTAGRVRDFHPLERVPAGHTIRKNSSTIERGVLIRSSRVIHGSPIHGGAVPCFANTAGAGHCRSYRVLRSSCLQHAILRPLRGAAVCNVDGIAAQWSSLL